MSISLTELVYNQGLDIDNIPFIRIVPVSTPQLKSTISLFSGEQPLVIFTSANSVQQVTALLSKRPQWQIACLEGATQQAVISFFGSEAIRYAAANATLLAEKLIAGKVQRVLFFCGNNRLHHLPDALNEAGIGLEELVVYETQATPAPITGSYDAVLFFSPSAVDSFYSLNTLPVSTMLFAIGDTTAMRLRKYSDHNLFVSPEPTPEALIQLVLKYVHN